MTHASVLILSNRPWNKGLAQRLSNRLSLCVETIDRSEDLTIERVEEIDPRFIFAPHWSKIIPSSIYSRWKTLIFHMTDLPYGRGGSPLQNLIVRGYKSTVISAIECTSELDSGDIYMQEPLSLEGSAEEIYIRADEKIEDMIVRLIRSPTVPRPQEGHATIFERRTPSESNLNECKEGDIVAWFNHIRMMDADGYPLAYLDALGMRIEFKRVSRRIDGLHADVTIKPLH